MTTTIYYSNFNLDSVFSAFIIQKYLKTSHNVNTNLVKYDRVNAFIPCEKQDRIFIVGADVSPLNLNSIVTENPDAEINIINYHNVEKYNDNLNNKIFNDYTKMSIESNDGHLPNSLSEIIVKQLELKTNDSLFYNTFINTNKEDFFRLVDSIAKYCNFLLMTQEETLLVFKNINNIYNAMDFNDDFNITIPTVKDDKEYIRYIKNLRVILDRNFAMRYLTANTTWLTSPILSVSAENAFAIMRLISYSYDDIVTYEDTANARIYRVYSKCNKEWLFGCIKPSDVWVEGNMYFLKTDIPSVQK